MKPKVFVTRAFPGPGLKQMEEECELSVWSGEGPPKKSEILKRVPGAQGILSMLTDPIDEDVLHAAGSTLRVISNYAVGFDNIDVKAASSRAIPVGNTPGVLTDATADLAFGLLMAAARRLVEGADYAKQGKWTTWSPGLLLGGEVKGATLGILGLGRIGRAMAKRARGFDMNVLGYGRRGNKVVGVENVDFDELLTKSDYLSLHVPLTAETDGVIDESVLGLMKPTSVLINTSRGGVVKQDALFDALKSGQIGYAALDVTTPEPLPPTHPLYSLENCLIVPHLGSATVVTRAKMGVMAAKNLLAGLRGEPLPHCVNPEVYDSKKGENHG